MKFVKAVRIHNDSHFLRNTKSKYILNCFIPQDPTILQLCIFETSSYELTIDKVK